MGVSLNPTRIEMDSETIFGIDLLTGIEYEVSLDNLSPEQRGLLTESLQTALKIIYGGDTSGGNNHNYSEAGGIIQGIR